LNNLINNHPNLISIPEENVYWLLKKEYGHIRQFSEQQLHLFLDDLYFLLTKSEHKFSEYIFPKKEELYNIIINEKVNLSFLNVSKLIYLNTIYALSKDRSSISQIVNKEIQFNHLIPVIKKELSLSKFIVLIRDPRANIYSSLRTQPNRKNLVYHAKKWVLENTPLIFHQENENTLFIKYEELVANPEHILSKIFNFLGVEPKPAGIQNTSFASDSTIQEFFKNLSISKAKTDLFNKYHFGSVSKIDSEKTTEWKTKKVFSESELRKIEFICSDLANQFGYEMPFKKVRLSITDYFHIFLAKLDYYVACKYILMPVKLKKLLRSINFLNFYQ